MKKTKRPSMLRTRLAEVQKNGVILNIFGLVPLACSILLVGVLLWGLFIAFTDPAWYLDNTHAFIPQKMTLSNFADAFSKITLRISDPEVGFRDVRYIEMFWNSIWYSVGGTVMKIASTMCFAYVVARFEFPGRKLLHGFVILQLMLPIYGQSSANYVLLSDLHLVDNPWYLLSQGAGHGMYFLISYNFFRNISYGYVEAAKIDGAGAFTIFGRVVMPLAKPIAVALGIMTFIGYWNDYSTVIVYLRSHPTLSAGLFQIKNMAFTLGLQTPQYFAAIFIAVFPVAVLFIIFNKQIMSNMSIGGLKE